MILGANLNRMVLICSMPMLILVHEYEDATTCAAKESIYVHEQDEGVWIASGCDKFIFMYKWTS